MSRNIYALLVGINDYDENVGRLEGCVNDVQSVQDFLMDSFDSSKLHLDTLLNRDATRDNLVEMFRNHLSRAKAGDVVLFQYCGHGARAKSALEFNDYYPAQMEEGLVLFDSRLPGGRDLADKELAALFHEVAANEPHLVAILDCCHSGSATRCADDLTLKRSRQTHEISEARSLESYLDGYYVQQKKQTNRLTIPTSRHVLLSACRRTEKAWETQSRRGLFTSCLLEVLERSGPEISYADLFLRTRGKVLEQAQNQNPQFEVFGRFNAYSGFLDGKTSFSPPRFQVEYQRSSWQVNCGALNGLPTDATQPIEVMVHDPSSPDSGTRSAQIVSVGAHSSRLDLVGLEEIPVSSKLEAELVSLPIPPLRVLARGDAEMTSRVVQHFESNPNCHVSSTPDAESSTILIECGERELKLLDRESGRLIQSFEDATESSLEALGLLLVRIHRWQRLLQVQSEETPGGAAAFSFKFKQMLVEGGFQDFETGVWDFAVTENGERDRISGSLVAANRTGQTLHYLLVYFSSDFGIQVLFNDEIEPSDDEFVIELEGHPEFHLNLSEGEGRIGIHHFKLIVSAEKIDDFVLTQEAIEMGGHWGRQQRGLSLGSSEKPTWRRKHWDAKTITMRLHRVSESVGREDSSFAGGAITIKGHESFSASVGLGGGATTRGIEEGTTVFHLAKSLGSEVVDLGTSRGGSIQSVELSDFQNEHDLATDPLMVELKVECDDTEVILPVSYDGEHLVLCGGAAQSDSGNVSLSIDHLPRRQGQQRSLIRAVKLYFLKMYVGRERVNRLRWVEFEGGLKRHDSLVSERVKNANSILVVIHGIIGDSFSIAKSLESIRQESGSALDDQFDLVLTYDYESLHTPISETAEDFLSQLAEVGISEGHGKQVTIMAHSMGGLVTRYAIEGLGANTLFEHVIMFGTPNQGSPFGKIRAARNLASFFTTIAMNGFPAFAAYGATLLYLLDRSKNVTVCLEELSPTSTFIRELNSCQDPGVRYTVIAGDIGSCDPAENEFITKIMKKAKCEGLVSQLYGGEANDIAVSVASIKGVGADRSENVETILAPCHHLNYFSSEAGVGVVKRLLTGNSTSTRSS